MVDVTGRLLHADLTDDRLKCLLPEHQAQTINYLTAADLSVGLLVKFGRRTLEYKRVCHPLFHPAAEGDPASEADLVFFNLNPVI